LISKSFDLRAIKSSQFEFLIKTLALKYTFASVDFNQIPYFAIHLTVGTSKFLNET